MNALTLSDGLQNVIAGLGGAGDKLTYNRYVTTHISSAQVDAAYRTSGLCRKVHDLKPQEMTRAGRDWQTDATDITTLTQAEKTLGVWAKLRLALEYAARYGGAAIVLGIDRGAPDTPLRPEMVRRGDLKFITVLTRDQITIEEIDQNPYSPFYGEPEYYRFRDGTVVDPSRVIPVIGQPLPNSDIGQFWGDPLLMSLWNAISNSDLVQSTIAALLPEIKADTLGIPGLTRQLATAEYERLLMKRVQTASLFQSMFNVKLIDSGDGAEGSGEKWETRQLNVSGYPELMTAFMGRVAAETDIPVTRLAGISPGGMQSTGKGEQVDFEKHISARQELDLRPIVDRLDQYLIPSALGARPNGLYWTFAPLSQMSEAERAEVQYKRAQAYQIRMNAGGINPDALSDAEVNSMIESGDYPGLEQSIAAHGLLSEEPEPEDDPSAIVPVGDAAPRSLYVRRDVVNVDELMAWAAEQGFTDIVPDMHVTIMYSRTPVDWIKMGDDYRDMTGDGKGQLVIKPGGPRVVEPLGSATAVLMFASSDLSWRNHEMREAGASFDYPDYQPHVTISYGKTPDLATIQPYRGRIVFGPEIFEEIRGE